MKFFSFYELFSAFLGYLGWGVFCGVFYSCSLSMLYGIKKIVLIPYDICISRGKPKKFKYKMRQKIRFIAMINLYDFFCFLIFGAIFIFITYIFLDGVLRFYFLVLFFLAGFFANKFCGKFFEKRFAILFNFLYRILYCILYPVFIPVGYLLKLLQRLLVPIKKHILFAYNKRHSKTIEKLKFKHAQNFFERL